ncbi:MAG: cation transporter [Chlamydia sp. 32-24]|nr:MAG: cation transporter [Chlamydia sp. 32-24]
MTKFPDPQPIPMTVHDARYHRKKELIDSSFKGILIRLAIVVAEFIGFFVFGSYSLLMDGLASFLDICISLILVFFIHFASRPPDSNHPFGHGRFEPLVGLQLGIFLATIGGFMFYDQTFSLATEGDREAISSYAWIIPLAAVFLLELCYQIVMRVAKRENSPALAADAAHYRIDGVTSLFAAIALIAGAYLPQWSHALDHIGAILIALLMIIIGIGAARNNFFQITDKKPEKKFFDCVEAAAKKVEGVKETEKIRIQQFGPDAFVSIDVEVQPEMSVEKAHIISQKVRLEIQKDWPNVRDVIVHIEPFYANDH